MRHIEPVVRQAGLVLLILATLLSCKGDPKTPETLPPVNCDLLSQNQYVFDLMKDFYFWYGEVPEVDPSQFSSPEELLETLKFSPLDRFSGVSDQQTQALFLGQGKFIGIGLRLKSDEADRLFVAFEFSGSPAAQAGIVRGTEIIAINGNLVSTLLTGDDFDNAWGDTSVGTTATLDILLPGASSTISTTLTREVVTIDSTQIVDTFIDPNDVKFGYLLFTNFFGGSASTTPLSNAFSFFKNEDIDELILDLRYNGGGAVPTAVHLGSLIGGTKTAGSIFAKTIYSDRYSRFNTNTFFSNKFGSLSLDRIYVITSPATCSASEMLINSLRPHIEVITIGDTTCGKPVGSNPQNFCDKTINAINFEFRNSLDQGEFFDGLPASCASVDDLSQALGAQQDNAVAIASYYQQNSQCSALSKFAKRRPSLWRESKPDQKSYMVDIY